MTIKRETVDKFSAAFKKAAAAKNGHKNGEPATARPAPIVLPEPYIPFPTDALPYAVRNFVSQASRSLGCDESFFALPAIVSCAAAIGTTRQIRLKDDWPEPCVLWGCTVADSGSLKSPAAKKAVKPMFKLEFDLYRKYREDRDAWNRDKKAGTAAGNDPEPKRQRILTGDVTIEKLAEMLEDNPRGILVFRDELAGWFGSFMKYKAAGAGSDVSGWLPCYSAEPLIVDRKNGLRPSLIIPAAAVNVFGTIQPGILAKALTLDHIEAGLAARLLLAMPPRRKKRWNENVINPDVSDSWKGLIQDLWDNCQQQYNSRKSKQGPVEVRLDRDAREIWARWFDEWADVQDAADGALHAAYVKLEAVSARLALIHHVVSLTSSGVFENVPITPASMTAAIALTRWFANEARRIYSQMSEDPDAANTRKLVAYLKNRAKPCTVRDLQRSHCNNGLYDAANAATAALNGLVDGGLGHWVDIPSPQTGSHATRAFVFTTAELVDKRPETTIPDYSTLDTSPQNQVENQPSVECRPEQEKQNAPQVSSDHGDAYLPPPGM